MQLQKFQRLMNSIRFNLIYLVKFAGCFWYQKHCVRKMGFSASTEKFKKKSQKSYCLVIQFTEGTDRENSFYYKNIEQQ